MSEFCLSNKAIHDNSYNPIPDYYWEHDIKETMSLIFKDIKRLSHDNVIHLEVLNDIFKHRLGEKLI